jgi:uncharacterized protein (TIGR02466 family)
MKNIIQPIFSNFIFQTDLKIDLKKLKVYLDGIVSSDSGRQLTNYGGYQSNDLEVTDDLSNLITQVSDSIDIVSSSVGINKKLKLDNFWLNVNGHKDFNQIHNHPHAVLSAIFYVSAPLKCGNLILKNSGGTLIKSYLDYHSLVPNVDYNLNSYLAELWKIFPEENVLTVFPSWLEHYVEPNNNETEKRISIAFNYSY